MPTSVTVLSMALCGMLLCLDRLPRFVQGDSISYLSTGMNGWIPFDRSWAYGFASRWLVEATGAPSALVVFQAVLLLGAALSLGRVFVRGNRQVGAALTFALLASLDPLNQTLARFWLSDTAAEAAFLVFVSTLGACLLDQRRIRPFMPVLAASVLISIFVRVAYVPIEIGTLLMSWAVTFLPGYGRLSCLRRRLLGLALLPIMATGCLAIANSQISIAPLRGQVFVNRTSCLFNMGTLLPGLRYADFQRAGIPMTQSEFDGFHLDRYDDRVAQMWGAEPQRLRAFLQMRLNTPRIYNPRLLQACSAVLRSAALHHPQTLLPVYLHNLAEYFDVTEWTTGFRSATGFDRPLPDWVAAYLTRVSGRLVTPDVTGRQSLLPTILGSVIGFYPILLLAGAARSVFIVLCTRPFGRQHVVAAALLSSLVATALYTQGVIARYVLVTVMLCELQMAILFADLIRRAVSMRSRAVMPLRL